MYEATEARFTRTHMPARKTYTAVGGEAYATHLRRLSPHPSDALDGTRRGA